MDGPVADGVPVFVVQRGRVAAVILSRAAFDRLATSERRPPQRGEARASTDHATVSGGTGVECFGTLPRGTLFETPWNLVDAETASFFMEEGIPVRPHLKGWLEPSPCDTLVEDGSAASDASEARSDPAGGGRRLGSWPQ